MIQQPDMMFDQNLDQPNEVSSFDMNQMLRREKADLEKRISKLNQFTSTLTKQLQRVSQLNKENLKSGEAASKQQKRSTSTKAISKSSKIQRTKPQFKPKSKGSLNGSQ